MANEFAEKKKTKTKNKKNNNNNNNNNNTTIQSAFFRLQASFSSESLDISIKKYILTFFLQ